MYMTSKNATPKYLLLYLIVITVFSCSKEEKTNTSLFTPSPLLLKERRINNLLHSSYLYNEDALISETTFYSASTGEAIYRDSYIYTADTTIRIRKDMQSNENIYTRKYYIVSEAQGRRDDYEDGEFVGYRYYNFDESPSCGYDGILTYNVFGQLNTAVDFDYIDDNCSYTITVSPTINSSYIESEYTRGEKYDAYNSIRLPFYRIDKYPNVDSYFRRDEEEEIIQTRSYRSEFEYNSHDHPTNEIRTYLDGIIHNITFTYY